MKEIQKVVRMLSCEKIPRPVAAAAIAYEPLQKQSDTPIYRGDLIS